MSQRQLLESNEDSSLELNEDCYREIAEKIAGYCSNINQFMPWLLSFAQVNNATRKSLKESRFKFFMDHYSVLPKETTGFYILNKGSITATNVRLGNQMTLEGIELYFSGRFVEAEALFIKAMCEHGSSNAMQILDKLSQLSEKSPLHLEKIISLYSAQEMMAIKLEFMAFLPIQQHNDCNFLLLQPKFDLNNIVQGFKVAISIVPLLRKTSRDYISNVEFEEMTDDRSFMSFNFSAKIDKEFQKSFDASGFLGLRAPKQDAWYEKTESSQLILTKFNL